MAGKTVSLAQVPDPTFRDGMLGSGIAILPSDGRVYAPCDATVDLVFSTGHAVSLVSQAGAEILIHVGLETVSLEGRPFTAFVSGGDRVKRGQLLLEADLEAIRAAGLSVITPVVICNTDTWSGFHAATEKDVTVDDPVIELTR